VDGADFYVGEGELGHLHLDGEAHVPVGKRVRAALVSAGFARPFPWSDGWVTHPVRREEHVARALWLFELSRAKLGGANDTELLRRVTSHAEPAEPAELRPQPRTG
jgi:hypothetical protein